MLRMKYLASVLILISSYTLFSQANYNLKSHYNGSSVEIIWLPADYISLNTGIEHGYTLVRHTIKTNTQSYNNSQIDSSKVIIVSDLKPLSKSAIDSIDISPYVTPWNQIGAGILYDTLESDIEFTSPAIKAIKQKEDRKFDMSLLGYATAVNDLGIALGLKAIDSSVQVGYTYLYVLYDGRVNLDSANRVALNMITQKIENKVYPTIEKPNASGSGNKIILNWNKEIIEDEYVGYNIYRSMDGGIFGKVNSEPYIALASPELNSFLFADSVDYTKRNYTYKIEGVDYFSGAGGMSDTVRFMPYPEPLDYYPLIDSIQNIGNVSFKVHWNFPSHVLGAITGYKVKRALSVDAPYTQIGSFIPKASPNLYLDEDVPGTAYYKVIAIDTNNYELESIPYMAQLDDTIPCAVPVGLSAEAFKNNRIEFAWNPNTEPDLSGYKIFMGQKQNGEFLEVTGDLATGSTYTYTFDMKTLRKELFFKISSVDRHGNYSAKSDAIKVELPDVVPPAAPVIRELIQGQGFMTLKYYPSASEDAGWHFIQRKSKNSPKWEEVGKYYKASVNDSTLKSFKDTAILTNQVYKYRVLCKDADGNNGISAELSGQPYASPIRNNKPVFGCDLGMVDGKKCIKFKPEFIDFNANEMTDLLVYRAIDNGPMILLNQISKSDVLQNMTTYDRVYIDRDLLFGQIRTYRYKLQILYWDGSMSRMSDEVSINYTP